MFIADIILQLHSFIAETERDFIRQRQAEGIVLAKAKGNKFGKRAIEIPETFDEVYERWKFRIVNSREAAKLLNVSKGTFLKWTKKIYADN